MLALIFTGARSEGAQMPGGARRERDKARRRTLQYVEPFVRAERRRFGEMCARSCGLAVLENTAIKFGVFLVIRTDLFGIHHEIL